ncbi:MAG: DUF3990 domain-containing protein [Treponema sp.]|nr:DUF3990 domain-containing protein [Treponema sp.]
MKKKTLYHGSREIVKKPDLLKSKPYNDYGRGFYCTENIELAKEWACTEANDGFVNTYELDFSKTNILNLSSGKYNILNWLTLLLKNRTFNISAPLAAQAKEYLLTNFLPDISGIDIIIGYRADDSYFAFAEDFINNTISLKQLSRAMYLGNLGEQVVLVSQKAFSLIRFTGSQPISKKEYYPKRVRRDMEARKKYSSSKLNLAINTLNDLFVLDILRGGIKNDDSRIQQILPK